MADVAVSSGDLDTAARTLWGEAEGEPVEGQQGVAWVFRNRLAAGYRRHHTLEGVCLDPKQFSAWNVGNVRRDKMLALPADSPGYKACYEVVRSVMAGEVDDPTGGANHYEVTGTGAMWDHDAKGHKTPPTAQIGRHSFYNVP